MRITIGLTGEVFKGFNPRLTRPISVRRLRKNSGCEIGAESRGAFYLSTDDPRRCRETQ
jgi:hypothetical protein